MFSVVPGVDDSDVSSPSGSENSGFEFNDSGDDESESTCVSHLDDDSDTNTNAIDMIEITAPQAGCTNPTATAPSGVSDQHWEKFQSLQMRRTETRWEKDTPSNRNYKRRRRMRRKRKSGQEQETDDFSAKQDHSCIDHKVRRKSEDNAEETNPQASTTAGHSNSYASKEQQEHWDTLKKYLNVNDHMKGLDHGKYAPKSGMEKKLDQAVAEGDFDAAEEISDKLATRDLACKIAKAANARDYLAWKHEQEERREANRKKKRKLAWGFEPKERWQMKGNM